MHYTIRQIYENFSKKKNGVVVAVRNRETKYSLVLQKNLNCQNYGTKHETGILLFAVAVKQPINLNRLKAFTFCCLHLKTSNECVGVSTELYA